MEEIVHVAEIAKSGRVLGEIHTQVKLKWPQQKDEAHLVLLLEDVTTQGAKKAPSRIKLMVHPPFASPLASALHTNDYLILRSGIASAPTASSSTSSSTSTTLPPPSSFSSVSSLRWDSLPNTQSSQHTDRHLVLPANPIAVDDVRLDLWINGRPTLAIPISSSPSSLASLSSQAILKRSVLPESSSSTTTTTTSSSSSTTTTASSSTTSGGGSTVKRRKVVMREYEYVSLAEVEPNVGSINLYGVVSRVAAPRKTRGSDWMMSITLRDESSVDISSELRINIFSRQDVIPPITREGDIVRVHRLATQTYRGATQGISRKRTSFAVFDGGEPIDGPVIPRPLPSGRVLNHTLTSADISRVHALRAWWMLDSTAPSGFLDDLSSTAPHPPLSSAPPPQQASRVVHSMGGCERTWVDKVPLHGGSADGACILLCVVAWDRDGTVYGWDGSDAQTTKEEEMLSRPPLQGFVGRWGFEPLPLHVCGIPSSAVHVLDKGRPNPEGLWVEFHSVVRSPQSNTLLVQGPVFVLPSPDSNARVLASKAAICAGSNAFSPGLVPSPEHAGRDRMLLKDVIAAGEKGPVRARVHARVFGIHPDPKDSPDAGRVPICPACQAVLTQNATSPDSWTCAVCSLDTLPAPDWAYLFIVTLVDAGASLDVFLTGDPAAAIAESITHLLDPHVYVDLCIQSYRDALSNQVRYTIFDAQPHI